MQWLTHFMGVDFDVPYGHWVWYNFWSGFFSCVTIFTAAGAITVHSIVSYRHKNCEVHRCWRLGRHTTAAGHYVCRKHHPDDKLTAENVLGAHNAAAATS